MEWQPIETAPAHFFYALLSWGGQIPKIGFIRSDGSYGLVEPERTPFFKDRPTHYMFLPAPPAKP